MQDITTASDGQTQISDLARQMWEQDGRPAGRDLEYWLRAEQQVLSAPNRPTDVSSSSIPARASSTAPKKRLAKRI